MKIGPPVARLLYPLTPSLPLPSPPLTRRLLFARLLLNQKPVSVTFILRFVIILPLYL